MIKLINRIWNAIRFRDRASIVDQESYGVRKWVARDIKTLHDLDAPKVNANVFIATRAISDAICSLPVDIVRTETTDGVKREVDDNNHIANHILQRPNPEHTWSELIAHAVKSYLNDGNAVWTIERNTGGNPDIELWPRDPRTMTRKKTGEYRFGNYFDGQKVYPRNRVIHIRDISPDNSLYGIGRINSIRTEIMMDYFINEFNKNFFVNGGTLNLMFTPEMNLTDDQHMEILDALSADVGGVHNAFKLFINKYAGKFETPDQKHTDIAFLDLLKHNREKAFGAFGLPPFRGGVMEYANYSNALAQDLDFWLNTIKPIIHIFEDAINKQLIWPLYGIDVHLRFNLNSVPAIKGKFDEQIDRWIALKDAGIVSATYVRQMLDIPEDAAPDITPDIEEYQGMEQRKITAVINDVLSSIKNDTIERLAQITATGKMMSTLCDPVGQSERAFNMTSVAEKMRNTLIPTLRAVGINRSNGGNQILEKDVDRALNLLRFQIENWCDQQLSFIRLYLADAEQFHWDWDTLKQNLSSLFTQQNGKRFSKTLLINFLKNTVNDNGHHDSSVAVPEIIKEK